MPIRTALIGYGGAGSGLHAPLIAATAGLELTTVVTSNADRAEGARRAHPGVRIETSADALFERAGEHDLIVVATPNDSHAGLASRAIELGLATVVDKPLAPTAADAAAIVERAERAGVPLSVFHNRRWDSEQLTLRRLIDAGELGEVQTYESHYERWRPRARAGSWRQEQPPELGGGLLLDLGTHLVDQALLLFGPVSGVHGEVNHRRGGPADDDVFLALEHESGVRSHLWASELIAAPGPRLRVLGSAAGFTVEGLDGQEAAMRAGRRPDDGEPWGVEPQSRWGHLHRGEGESEPVRSEAGDWPRFYAPVPGWLEDGGPPPVDPRDAVAVLEILERARSGAG